MKAKNNRYRHETRTSFKKCISFSLLVIILGFKAYSQDLTLGLKSGYDVVNIIETTSDQSLPSKPSFHVELFSNYNFNKTFQIQIEPGFIEKGSWTTKTKLKGTYKYGYFTLPAFLIIQPVNKLNLEIGPEFSYLVYAMKKDADGKVSEASFQEYYDHFEFSGIIGISYNFFKNNQIGFRFCRGFTPIYDVTPFLWDIDNFYKHKFYNRYFEFFTRISLIKFDLNEKEM